MSKNKTNAPKPAPKTNADDDAAKAARKAARAERIAKRDAAVVAAREMMKDSAFAFREVVSAFVANMPGKADPDQVVTRHEVNAARVLLLDALRSYRAVGVGRNIDYLTRDTVGDPLFTGDSVTIRVRKIAGHDDNGKVKRVTAELPAVFVRWSKNGVRARVALTSSDKATGCKIGDVITGRVLNVVSRLTPTV